MNENAELANFIYQNSQMGVNTINQLIDIVEDDQGEFKKYLGNHLNGYRDIHTKAKELLNKNGYDEKGIGRLAKIRTYLMINIQTLTDKSPSHIAKMLIVGSNMGIIDAVENIKKYKDVAEKDIVELMERLLKFEEDNVQQLKKFL
ncbi:MAG: hypothetical protein PHO01_11825 [Desulfotomaculaceae bacterium]|nr:hypothetical protein [Desulfotomaculaceae bacterium]